MKYAKFFTQVVATVVAAVVAALAGDNTVSNVEWVNIAILAVGAAAVFAGPNVPGARYTKVILSALAAALVVLTSAITNGVSLVEWLQIATAVLGSLGVYAVPNKDSAGNNLSSGVVR